LQHNPNFYLFGLCVRAILFALFALFLSASAVAVGDAPRVVTIGGNGQEAFSGDGGPAIRAGIGQPFGLVVGPDRALYVCSVANHVIRRIDLATGTISTVAGCGQKGYAGDGGPASGARLNEPYEVRFDADGNLFFVEMQNHVVRRVDARTKIISTVAGTGRPGFSGDGGPAINARLRQPHSIALDRSGQLYICDIGNNRLRRVDLARGTITTFCGTGKRESTPDDSPVAGTPLNGPRAVDFDGRHSLYLALREGNACYRIDLSAGRIHHVAGTGRKGYSGDGGDARRATLNGPKGIAVGPRGELYLADTENHVIRVIRGSKIETVVGDGQAGDGPDGDPRHCRLSRPHGIFADSRGTIYIGDSLNHRVRMLRLP
jgi:DNA-binding beta-propeller fold protein YncE